MMRKKRRTKSQKYQSVILITVSEVEALDEKENEVKVFIRKDFAGDEKKTDKFYKYVYPRLVTTSALRQISSLILVTKDDKDVVKETMCLHRIREMMDEVKKSPTKITWSLQKSVTFLHRFLFLVTEEMDDAEDRVVFTFSKDKDKRQVSVTKGEFECKDLTGEQDENEEEDDEEEEEESENDGQQSDDE
jgi:hypothetical protein